MNRSKLTFEGLLSEWH